MADIDGNFSFPFQDIDGDRMYGVDIFTNYWRRLVGNGIFPNPSTNLQVMAAATPSMSIQLYQGASWFNGVIQWTNKTITFDINPSHASLNRYDAIAIRFDYLERQAYPMYYAGTPATTPTKPNPVRSSSYNDLILAYIYVPTRSTQVVQANIEDTRQSSSLCGIVTGLINQVDVTTIYNQFYDWFNTTKQTWQDWWDDQQDNGGYLTVNGINPSLTTMDQTVLGAINELNSHKAGDRIMGNLQIYVDAVNGDNNNDGKTSQRPVKMLSIALYLLSQQYNDNMDEATINLAPTASNVYYEWPATESPFILNHYWLKNITRLTITSSTIPSNYEGSGGATIKGYVTLRCPDKTIVFQNIVFAPPTPLMMAAQPLVDLAANYNNHVKVNYCHFSGAMDNNYKSSTYLLTCNAFNWIEMENFRMRRSAMEGIGSNGVVILKQTSNFESTLRGSIVSAGSLTHTGTGVGAAAGVGMARAYGGSIIGDNQFKG